jgi:hypothetical protein
VDDGQVARGQSKADRLLLGSVERRIERDVRDRHVKGRRRLTQQDAAQVCQSFPGSRACALESGTLALAGHLIAG